MGASVFWTGLETIAAEWEGAPGVGISQKPRCSLFVMWDLTLCNSVWLVWDQEAPVQAARPLCWEWLTLRRPGVYQGGNSLLCVCSLQPQPSDNVTSLGCVLFVTVRFSHDLFRLKH